ncbi:hypothetical protein ACRZ5S_23030 (plasmid) [Vibrio scophthalmi]|uniref:hypothetical protein n=1 Tax=Vibrio scophthalmi TaxID=45658 RepID=UPI003EC00DFA
MNNTKFSRSTEHHLHIERVALEIAHLGGSFTTISDLLGTCPPSAKLELKRLCEGRKKTRIGKNVSFLHRDPMSFRVANKLWLYYATLRQDPLIQKRLNVDLMLSAFNFAMMDFDFDICDHVDFNRFNQLLTRVKDGTVMSVECNCGSSYIIRCDRVPTSCPDCLDRANSD